MVMESSFPVNPFPIVDPEDFDKNTKKKFTEDYIDENLRSQGWSLYEPYVDKGYDRVAVKNINGKKRVRFIQVKARALKKGSQNQFYAGYTISTKDLISDPRIVFVLFSHEKIQNDHVRDILFFPIVEWLKFMKANYSSLFSSLGFKQGDGKFNDTYYNPETKKWSWGAGSRNRPAISLDNFVNKNGLELIEKSTPEDNFIELKNWITKFKNENIYDIKLTLSHPILKKPENQYLIDEQVKINNEINIKNISTTESKLLIKSNNKIFNENNEARISAMKYFGNLEKKILDI